MKYIAEVRIMDGAFKWRGSFNTRHEARTWAERLYDWALQTIGAEGRISIVTQ